MGHSRPSRAGSNSDQVGCATESGSRQPWSPKVRTEPIELHRSPGRHVDGGALAEIFRCLSATKWLLLNA